MADERSSPRNAGHPPPQPAQPHLPHFVDPAVVALFGPGVTQWAHSEDAFVQALALKTEQEKTKQEFYRLEVTNRSLELLRSATNANIPSHLIPLMFSGGSLEGLQPPQPQFLVPQSFQQKGKQPFRHDRSQTISTPRELYNPYNANPTPPAAYRFGGGPAPPNRPLSPAKLGAKAVASLSGDRPLRSAASAKVRVAHHRNASLPNPSAASATIPEASTVSFSRPPEIIPTQESMTSLQHVIQFHHWQPEHPKAPGDENERKRRKSSSDQSKDDEERPMLPPAHKRTPSASVAKPAEQYSGVNILADAAMNLKHEQSEEKKETPTFPNNILSSPV
ncbi:hypothetical protein BABINDRAFT_162279 [Babjeviella inositovora NRRL Y-12698]|uniref:Uncharacterized protein n=1 Tax=Babjeviella inositovora NRRL Y-12698 TaxID=984486 RepID=A0A1E3QNH9_9ASCO|nr:uncharacterized protein BABINDRAFT_162279 [Babjeviella inositovora NRRL Y-12698]ODQ79243.1 hypothetical protein BABINDRAFT_162279 [Babjeviella inositovora NRRL Y-12698]